MSALPGPPVYSVVSGWSQEFLCFIASPGACYTRAVGLPSLAGDVVELDRDAADASRVAQLCKAAAGQRLIEIRRALGMKGWYAWLNADCPLSKGRVGELIKARKGCLRGGSDVAR